MVLFLSALILDFSTLCNGRNLAIKGKASKHARQDWTDADDDLYSESMQSDSSTEDTTGSEDTTSNEDTTTDEDGIRAEVEEDMQEEKSAVSEEEDTKGTKDDKQVQGENTSEESKKKDTKNSDEATSEQKAQSTEETDNEAVESEPESAETGDEQEAELPVDQTVYEEEPTQAPQKEPFEQLYDDADAVARDLELRRGHAFYPEGSHQAVDMDDADQSEIPAAFGEEPSVFKDCLLIRDFAMPLRVGSAIIEHRSHLRASSLRWRHKHHSQAHHESQSKTHHNMTKITAAHSASFARFHHLKETPDKLPDSLLIPKGGVVDREAITETASGDVEESGAELQINMFAFLQSVAGEVGVIPNGGIAKWGSKRKVPIAGYLCTSESGPVLHTLETPCVPTAIDDEGMPFPPPSMTKTTTNAPAPAGPDDEANLFQQAAAPAASPSASPIAPPGLQPPVPPPLSGPYHVWVGNEKLTFSSKPVADRFCKRLTEHIAQDLGDEEWNVDELPPEVRNVQDPSLTSFIQSTRKASSAWTTGKKTLLVVIMDWMVGDRSRQPFSEQKLKPDHYKRHVFPRVREAFKSMSYGQFDLDVTFVPEVIRYTRPRSRYASEGYPFPGLYNGAEESLAGNSKYGRRYDFKSYDLVYVINPQQAPTGTKGVAWVGAKGAICNGCEEISDNFKVMVAVHELGHNLGLSHASSTSLEYGNVFDWMGNYPDVEGLSYGLGYKLKLDWLPAASISTITDQTLGNLNDEYYIMPYDTAAPPTAGQLAGVQVDLKENPKALYISFRKTVGVRKGVYLTWQDRDKPNSEIIDCACHTPSQQDARLQQGWTYMDPSNKIAVFVAAVDDHVATIRIFAVPDKKAVTSIRARNQFTDGVWKCPRTCTDSDLLVSMYNGCPTLKKDGYCRGGSITMGGSKLSIGTDLCPQSCGKCDEVTSGSPLKSGGCKDRNIKISGMTCSQIPARGYCNYNTNMGHIGQDLCPKSCGNCPASFGNPSGHAGNFPNPTPIRVHGSKGQTSSNPIPPDSQEQVEKQQEQEQADEQAAEDNESKDDENDEQKANGELCTDDPVWTDSDGDGCKVYDKHIQSKKLTREEACGYNDGQAQLYCRKTCKTCKPKPSNCQDKECVTSWKKKYGKCFACADWPAFCDEKPVFKADCPLTCGVCKPEAINTQPPMQIMVESTEATTTTTTTTTITAPPPCEDEECVGAWLNNTGKCYKCSDFAEEFCGRDQNFMESCPRTCRTCIPTDDLNCQDDFRQHTCKRYAMWHWCGIRHIADHCKASCGICQAIEDAASGVNDQTTLPPKSAAMSLKECTFFAMVVSFVASAIRF